MSEERRGFLSQVWGCVASPRKALESIRGEDIWKGVVLVLILTAVSALAGYNYASKLPVKIPEGFGPHEQFGPPRQFADPEAVRRNIMTFSAMGDGLRAISGWLIPAVLLHLFASLLAGKGSLRRTLALTGFASIPLIFQQILRLIDAYTISKEAFLSIIAAPTLGPTLTLRLIDEASSVFTAFGLWTFALTVVAISINYKASTARAAAAASSSYLAFILIRLFLPI